MYLYLIYGSIISNTRFPCIFFTYNIEMISCIISRVFYIWECKTSICQVSNFYLFLIRQRFPLFITLLKFKLELI